MSAIYGWSVTTGAGDVLDLSVRTFDEDEDDVVSLTAQPCYGDNVLLTAKEARELARDLNAAAKVAATK